MTWQVPRIWEGMDVWIIGGGPSVPRQFNIPESVTRQVIEGSSPPSVYSPYMKPIHDCHVIGVNMSYRIGDWIDIVFFGDDGFFLREKGSLAQFPGLKVTCNSHKKGESWIKYLARDDSHTKGLSTDPTKVSWNGNSGAAAINVAVHAGAKRIILLGFDMKLASDRMQHWHNLYNRGPVQLQDHRRVRKLPFDRHLACFPIIAEDAKRLKVEIINACPDSAIGCFPKFALKELLWDNS